MFGHRIGGSKARLAASLTATLGLVVALLGVVVAASPPAQAQTSLPAQCEAGRIFALGRSGNLYSTLTPTASNPGASSTQIADFTPTGTANTGVNGLGVSENASTLYAV